MAVATALAKTGRSVWLFEQNSVPGQETTSRNSEGGIPAQAPEKLQSYVCIERSSQLYVSVLSTQILVLNAWWGAVIHAGIYYAPGSLKAQLCVRGKELLYKYAKSNIIPHQQIGKLIVCTEPWQLEKLEQLNSTAHRNGVTDCVILSEAEVKAREPALRAYGGLCSPSTGIVDSHGLMESLQGELQQV